MKTTTFKGQVTRILNQDSCVVFVDELNHAFWAVYDNQISIGDPVTLTLKDVPHPDFYSQTGWVSCE